MRGHVRKRGTTWSYVIDVGLDTDGRRRQQWKGGFPTKRQAEAALAKVLGQLRDGSWIEPTRLTVAEFLVERWLPAVQGTIRPTTFAGYRTHVHNHLVPLLGCIRCSASTRRRSTPRTPPSSARARGAEGRSVPRRRDRLM